MTFKCVYASVCVCVWAVFVCVGCVCVCVITSVSSRSMSSSYVLSCYHIFSCSSHWLPVIGLKSGVLFLQVCEQGALSLAFDLIFCFPFAFHSCSQNETLVCHTACTYLSGLFTSLFLPFSHFFMKYSVVVVLLGLSKAARLCKVLNTSAYLFLFYR